MRSKFKVFILAIAVLTLISHTVPNVWANKVDVNYLASQWLRDQDEAVGQVIISWFRNAEEELEKALLELVSTTLQIVMLKEDDPGYLERYVILFGMKAPRHKLPGYLLVEVFRRNGIDLFSGLENKSYRLWPSEF